jgi:hypothetical protein
MILEIFLFIILCLVILVFFYKQSVTDFRLSQVSDFSKVPSLLKEKNPIVVQPFIVPRLWSLQEIADRKTLGNMIVPEYQMSLAQIGQIETAVAPWSPDFARDIAAATGLPVWAEQTLKTSFTAPIYSYRTEVYLGPQGLQKTFGLMTILAVTDGKASVTLLNEQSDPYLPSPPQRWKGKLMSALTRDEAPLIGQIQCIDVILRPGTALIIPPHWKYCLEDKDATFCSIKIVVHHPISLMMEKVAMRN